MRLPTSGTKEPVATRYCLSGFAQMQVGKTSNFYYLVYRLYIEHLCSTILPAWRESLWKLTTCQTNKIASDFAAISCTLTNGTSRLSLQNSPLPAFIPEMCNQLIQAVILLISFLRVFILFVFFSLSFLHYNKLFEKKTLITGSQIFYFCTHNFCTDSFLFHIKFMYAYWKQIELVNYWYIIICRQMLNPKENFTEWKLCTCSLTIFLRLCIYGNNRFLTLFCILYSENCNKYWKRKMKFTLKLKKKYSICSFFSIWGSNS